MRILRNLDQKKKKEEESNSNEEFFKSIKKSVKKYKVF